MTVVSGTVEEYVVTVESGDEPLISVEVVSGGDPIDVTIVSQDAEESNLTIETEPEVVEIPADSDVEVLVEGSEVVIQVDDVPMGPPGPPGGGGGGAATYVHTQALPATIWTVVHNLGYDPAGITVIDEDGYYVDGFGLAYFDPGDRLRLTFDLAVAGTARLS